MYAANVENIFKGKEAINALFFHNRDYGKIV